MTAWTLEHRVISYSQQYETRWVPASDNSGDMIREVRLTGKACVVCNCGENSGWVDQEQLPLPSEFFYQHMTDEEKVRWLEGMEP